MKMQVAATQGLNTHCLPSLMKVARVPPFLRIYVHPFP
jgi:hypothetical protein